MNKDVENKIPMTTAMANIITIMIMTIITMTMTTAIVAVTITITTMITIMTMTIVMVKRCQRINGCHTLMNQGYPHEHGVNDYMKAVAEYRKTWPTKQDVIEQTPDPAVREMILRMEQIGL